MHYQYSKKGAQGARNSGILEAKGEWIAFNDSDDEWLSDKLEKQIKELEKINFDKNYLVHGNCNVFNHQTNLTSYWKLPLREGIAISNYFRLLHRFSQLFWFQKKH